MLENDCQSLIQDKNQIENEPFVSVITPNGFFDLISSILKNGTVRLTLQ
jgi:hypothetical protein